MDAFAVYEALIALGWEDAGDEPCNMHGVITAGPASQYGYLHAKKRDIVFGRPVVSVWAASTTAGVEFPESFPAAIDAKHEHFKALRRRL